MIEFEGFTDAAQVGAGGLGVVFRATRVSDGSIVAIKVLREVSDRSVAWHRARRELAATLALTGHPHVVQLFELLELDRGPALVMEYLPGGSVAGLLARKASSLPLGQALIVARHTAAALVAAHARGIVHRDVKPQNLLIDASGQVKLCDFGIATLTRDSRFSTATRAWSLRYASPEDLDDDQPGEPGEPGVGPASDVYSLGATLLHAVHGAPPTIKQRLVPWVPPPADDRHRAAFDGLLAECLHPEPSARPSSVDLAQRLEALRQQHDPGAGRADGLPVVAIVAATTAAVTVPNAVLSFDTAVCCDGDPTLVRERPGGLLPSTDPSTLPQAVASKLPGQRVLPRATIVLTVVAAIGLIASLVGRHSTGVTAPITATSAPAMPPTPPAGSPADAREPATGPAPGTSIAMSSPGVLGQPRVVLVDRPGGLIDIADPAIAWPFGELGECLVQLPGTAELRTVPCDHPHDLQRVGSGALDPSGWSSGGTFDPAAVDVAVGGACASALDTFVGSAASGGFDVASTRPSAASWERGDRRFQCLIGVPGRRLVGDAAGGGPAGWAADNDTTPAHRRDGQGSCWVVERGVDPRTPRFSGVCSAD